MRQIPPPLAALAQAPWASAALACLAGGLLSLCYGMDTSYDVLNYHLYDGWAALHARIGFDMAPAGLQSYFNPVCDMAYAWMLAHGPAALAGFMLGAFGGLNYGLVRSIAWDTLSQYPPERRNRLAAGLALAGSLMPNVVFGIGSPMGDVSSALPVCAALAVLTRQWSHLAAGQTPLAPLLLAGVLGGVAAGLKLTNAPYALAICMAMAVRPGGLRQRLLAMGVVGAGSAVGLAATTGWWWWLLWREFGNPLFPQFSTLFPSPWTLPTTVADTRWLPRTIWEVLAWPLVFTLHGRRIGEQSHPQVLWVIVYFLYLVWLGRCAARHLARRSAASAPTPDAPMTFVLVVLGISYIAWMGLFSIGRYTTPIELLLPLAAWQLAPAHHAVPRRRVRQIIALCTVLGLLLGDKTLPHAAWTHPALHVELPPLPAAARTTVLLADGIGPVAWLATRFPPSVMFASVGSAFPAAPAYWAELRRRIDARDGPVYVVFARRRDWRADVARRAQALLDRVGATRNRRICAWLEALARYTRLHARVLPATGPRACKLSGRPQDRAAARLANAQHARQLARLLADHGLALRTASCRSYAASVGGSTEPYFWCSVSGTRGPQKADTAVLQ